MVEDGPHPSTSRVRDAVGVARGSRPPWVGIVANANSGIGAGRRRVERLTEELARDGLEPRVAWTPSERALLVAAADQHPSSCRCLVAVGGDGTVAALLNERPRVPVTVLPAGDREPLRPPLRDTAAARGGRGDDRRGPGPSARPRPGRRPAVRPDGRHRLRRRRRDPPPPGPASARPADPADPRAAYVEPLLRASLGYRFYPLTIRVEDLGRRGDPDRRDGLRLQPAALCPGPADRPDGPRRRRAAGPRRLPQSRPAPGIRYLWLVFRGLHLRRRASPSPGPTRLDRHGRAGARAARRRPRRHNRPGDDRRPWTAEVLPVRRDDPRPLVLRPRRRRIVTPTPTAAPGSEDARTVRAVSFSSDRVL